ncbi:hypothetical protein PIB30_103471 [Stylosanthes scabra]|uniref:Uncharacterized protein n=1 Tax=Stylosanthes scabra TaxID=79078 RepID=A0ABU6RYH3_9FABA|nr:hypothetical protein [Stylosanthes scabra]
MKLVEGDSTDDEKIHPDIANSMRDQELFLLLANRNRINAGDKLLVTATKNLIGGEFNFFCISMSGSPPDFLQVLQGNRLPLIFLFRGFNIVKTLGINSTAEEIAAWVQANRN